MLFLERRKERSWKTGTRKTTTQNKKNKVSEIYPQFCWDDVFLTLFSNSLFSSTIQIILISGLSVPWLHFCFIITVFSKRLARKVSCSPQQQMHLMFPDLASSPVSSRLLCKARLYSPHPVPRPNPERATPRENAANAKSISWHYLSHPRWELRPLRSYSLTYT